MYQYLVSVVYSETTLKDEKHKEFSTKRQVNTIEFDVFVEN